MKAIDVILNLDELNICSQEKIYHIISNEIVFNTISALCDIFGEKDNFVFSDSLNLEKDKKNNPDSVVLETLSYFVNINNGGGDYEFIESFRYNRETGEIEYNHSGDINYHSLFELSTDMLLNFIDYIVEVVSQNLD
jgi:hypothetical protein